ncbi:MAG TPA: chromosomal replication initiator protein DnaA, partial [Azospira sp.]|nr:chromosomal replication initiator protein DnaA [Azospira sp.]
MSGFWSICLSQFEQELPPQQFNTWIKPLRLEGEDNLADGLRLLAPNGFILKWVKERYLSRIEELAHSHFSTPIAISLGIGGGKAPVAVARPSAAAPSAPRTPVPAAPSMAPPPSFGPTPTPAPAPAPAPVSRRNAGPQSSYEKTRLIPGFTFDNLVVGKANDLARAAAMQVAQNPGISYNPLFIYGGVGLGKTHVIHAIGNAILQADPDKVVRYVHAEDYYSDVVRAYQQKSFDVFKRYYKSLDVLLVDDVQFFNGKNRTQEEFFFVFNALTEAKKQIIITCDTYPKDINGLDDRLVTRFDWGLT